MADEKQLEILQDKANFRSFKPKPFNMREFYDRAGHDIRDMLLSCHFRGEACSAEDFKVVSGPWRGCAILVSGRQVTGGRPGHSLCRLLGEEAGCSRVCFGQASTSFSTWYFVLREGSSLCFACATYHLNHPCRHSHT